MLTLIPMATESRSNRKSYCKINNSSIDYNKSNCKVNSKNDGQIDCNSNIKIESHSKKIRVVIVKVRAKRISIVREKTKAKIQTIVIAISQAKTIPISIYNK